MNVFTEEIEINEQRGILPMIGATMRKSPEHHDNGVVVYDNFEIMEIIKHQAIGISSKLK